MKKGAGFLLAIGLSLLPGCSSTQGSGTASGPVAKFTCIAPSLGFGEAGMLTITITRWSTDQERDMLKNTLVSGGPDKLLAALQSIRPPVGTISSPNTMGYDLFFARNNVMPDGTRQVVLATNRRVGMGEVASDNATIDYRFNLIEIRLDKNGNGEGKMAPASRVTWNPQTQKVEINSYSEMSVDLMKVKATS